MSNANKPTPPVDIIHEDSGPPLDGVEEKQDSNGVEMDDAQIEEPKDEAFKQSGQPEAKPKTARKKV
jgi:hypothetical protein